MSNRKFLLYDFGSFHHFSDDDTLPNLFIEYDNHPNATLIKELDGNDRDWLKKAWVEFDNDEDAVMFKLKHGHLYV